MDSCLASGLLSAKVYDVLFDCSCVCSCGRCTTRGGVSGRTQVGVSSSCSTYSTFWHLLLILLSMQGHTIPLFTRMCHLLTLVCVVTSIVTGVWVWVLGRDMQPPVCLSFSILFGCYSNLYTMCSFSCMCTRTHARPRQDVSQHSKHIGSFSNLCRTW